MVHHVALVLSLTLALQTAGDPVGYFQPDGVDYDSDIPTPATVLGHELGERPVEHHMMVRYLRTLADLSPRITIETIGHSIQGRPIEFLVVSSPANQARMEEIRARQVARTDPDLGEDPAAADPVVVWLNFGVHGAEAAGMDAVLPVSYHLAAGQGEELERTLEESVILITAVLNPDGHAKRIQDALSFMSRVPVADPAHAAHDLRARQRANHYWFDLNRQWLLLAQHEPRIWVDRWHEWKPNFSADFHAAALDEEARLYFVEESFPGYYIGTGSSYPQPAPPTPR